MTPGQPPEAGTPSVTKGKHAAPKWPGYSTTIHHEITGAGRIDYQLSPSATEGRRGDPHGVVKILTIDLGSHRLAHWRACTARGEFWSAFCPRAITIHMFLLTAGITDPSGSAPNGGYLKSILDKPWSEGVLRLRHVADVRFWARLRTQKRSDKGIDAGHVGHIASGAS